MEIVINKSRENENDVSIQFTLTDGKDIFQWHGDFPPGTDSLEDQKEKLRLMLYRQEYPDAPKDIDTLEEWEAFVMNGCEYVVIVEKIPFVSTHPKPTEVELLKERVAILEERISK